ncbi:unnamed protein product [Caenorhabditis bovis]|uniref:Uncharacterized protein n=1 Tax=Caenorhabditis bovis TaxID=2654633 RepID=A0A8S1ECL4_9PELO|nr:unnamed protein product [Caenorhabditis bovis]
MIQALLLIASVLGASVYNFQHSRGVSPPQTLEQVDPREFFAPRYDFSPIVYNECRWPILSEKEDDIWIHLKKKQRPKRPNRCASLPINVRWNSEERSVLVITESNETRCRAVDLQHPEIIELEHDIERIIPFEQFSVECLSDEIMTYKKTFANFKNSKREALEARPTRPSIAILYMNSMSPSEFSREFPRTLKYSRRNQFLLYSMFNKKYQTSHDAEINSLFDVNLGKSFAQMMKDQGCLTMTNRNGTGFDYDISSFVKSVPSDTDEMCTQENNYTTKRLLEAWAAFSISNAQKCHFSTVFVDNMEGLDANFIDSLIGLKAHNVLDNTIVMVLSADGMPINTFGNTYTGRVEERNPFMMIRVPQRLQKFLPDQYFQLEQNENRLMTHLDVFETLKSFVQISKDQPIIPIVGNGENGISLWQSLIPRNRSCLDAYIPEEFCLCQNMSYAHELAYNQTHDLAFNLYEKMSSQIINENSGCFDRTTFNETKDYVKVWTLNQKVLEGVEDPIEFLEFRMKTLTKNQPERRGPNFFITLGYFKNYLKSNTFRIELAHPYVLGHASIYCMAGYVSRFCDMCYESLLASP